jgi:streptogramin lyase
MRISTRVLFLLALLVAVLVFVLTGPGPAAHRQPPFASADGRDESVQLPDRRLDVSAPAITPALTAGDVQASVTVTVTNTGTQAFGVQPDDLALSAEGDMLGQGGTPSSTRTLTGTVGPGVSHARQLRFVVPRAALPELTLLYHARGPDVIASVPLGGASIVPAATGAPTTSLAASVPLVEAAGFSMTNTSATGNYIIEDTFTRPNQTGWGTTTNPDGVPNVTWGMDGNGAKSYVTVGNTIGVYGYPGVTNVVGIASSGSATYNGGDSLVKFALSAVGHVTPYVVQNACGDKSCYYGARLHTSQNKLELAKRSGNGTTILASVPFTASATTFYWMRLDVVTGASDTVQAKIWADGSPEPTSWMLTATDASPLSANLVGAGGSWDQPGTGESIHYACYAYAASGLAAPCGTGPVPTPAPTATATPMPTVSPIQEYRLSGGVGEPWGTAMDTSGNVWFAEPGCDFAPTCGSSTAPGQLGEFLAGSNTVRFYRLPNIAGNQPIFVALDSAGNVWFTTPNNSMIGAFNPTTQSFVGQWAVTPGSGPWDLTFANGKIWYTEHLVSAVGAFDPRTHTHSDFMTPTNNTNPYGITASGSLIWFTENNSSVARIAKLDTAVNNQISEYLIRRQLPGGLTPHMIGADANGHPWWTEGWVRAIGTLDPGAATPGQCGTVSSTGDCTGVTEVPLPASTSTCNGSHVSGLAVHGGSSRIWLDDSLSNQVGAFNPATNTFALDNLNCVHPHDGLNLDPALHVWWDEEFNNALGQLTQ